MQNKKTEIENNDYISEKVDNLIKNIGSQYGELLLDELFKRLDNTIDDFDNEINDLFSSLKEREEKKQSVISLMKKGKTVVQKTENDNELISDWEIKLAEIEGEKK